MSYVVLIDFFQSLFKVLVKKKNSLSFDDHFLQNYMNLDRKKILTKAFKLSHCHWYDRDSSQSRALARIPTPTIGQTFCENSSEERRSRKPKRETRIKLGRCLNSVKNGDYQTSTPSYRDLGILISCSRRIW